MRYFFALATAVLAVAGCDFVPKLSPDSALMAGKGAAPVEGPDCASCHPYPLSDVNHQYHLVAANVNRNNLGQPELNAVTTCMDCHYNSIRHFGYVHADTTWMDSNGTELLEHTSPSDKIKAIARYPRFRPLPYGGVDTTRGEVLADTLDSLIFRRARVGGMVQWMTSFAHENGELDIAFAPNDVTSPGALKTAWHPKDMSCSSITCHTSREDGYRWADASKGLGNCPSLTGQDSTCINEVTP